MNPERILAVLCAVLGVILLFVGAVAFAIEGRLSQGAGYTLLAGLALLIGYGILDPGALRDLVGSRGARFGSLSVLVTAVVLAILVVVNILAARGDQAADLTKARLHTLSPQSVLVATRLDSDLQVTGFFRPSEGASERDLASLVALYRQHSSHIKVSFLDPDTNPVQVTRLGVTIPGSLALQYKSKPPIVLTLASQTESDLTAAILKLESNRVPIVCWAVGEGERDLKEQHQVFGYSAAATAIQNQNFKTQDLVLSQSASVPASCDVVAVMGLQKPFNETASKALADYLAAGGRLILATDPWIADAAAVASANNVLKPYGVGFDGGLVLEADPAHAARDNATTLVVFTYGNSPIAKDLNNLFSVFPQATPISGQPPGELLSVAVAQTTNQAFDIKSPRDNFARAPGDRQGPFTVMQTLESQPLPGAADQKKMRIVLFGTSAIAENAALQSQVQNDRLLIGSLDWLTEQENLISIAPKSSSSLPLNLTDQQLRFNFVLTIFLLPALVVAAGILVWLRRRRSYTAA